MARINNARLRMGRVSGSQEYAEVTFQVNFTTAEVEQNLLFGLHTMLYERDDSIDVYIPRPNGAFSLSVDKISKGNADDYVRYLDSRSIRPNGRSTQFFRIRREFNVGNQEGGNEEYRALVNIIPEIAPGRAWTNELSINLG